MTLSQKLMWNNADNYILHLAGFPIDRISSFDATFKEIEDSLYIHVCSLSKNLHLECGNYSKLIFPKSKVEAVRQHIECYFADVNPYARHSFWTIIIQYLWIYTHSAFSEIKFESRFKDPELGEFFRLLEEAKKNGFFSGKSFLE